MLRPACASTAAYAQGVASAGVLQDTLGPSVRRDALWTLGDSGAPSSASATMVPYVIRVSNHISRKEKEMQI